MGIRTVQKTIRRTPGGIPVVARFAEVMSFIDRGSRSAAEDEHHQHDQTNFDHRLCACLSSSGQRRRFRHLDSRLT